MCVWGGGGGGEGGLGIFFCDLPGGGGSEINNPWSSRGAYIFLGIWRSKNSVLIKEILASLGGGGRGYSETSYRHVLASTPSTLTLILIAEVHRLHIPRNHLYTEEL